MRTRIRQNGFSLLEVMMAVVVLMMGMVFVASMFPVGLHNSRKNVEQTINAIESHNAAVMAELVFNNTITRDEEALEQYVANVGNVITVSNLKYSYFNEYNKGDGYTFLNEVHFIPKPNIFADSIVPAYSGRVFIADLEYEFYENGSIVNFLDISNLPFSSVATPFSLLASQNDSVFLNTAANIGSETNLFGTYCYNYSFDSNGYLIDNSGTPSFPLSGDIGRICCPIVDENHPDVVALAGNYDQYNVMQRRNRLYPAIYRVALQQKYTWAAAYKEIGRDNQGKEPYQLSIFILKQGGDNARYAMQNPVWQKLARPADPYYPYLHASAGEQINIPIPEGVSYRSAEYDCR
ncbi:MAG: prepilin-type N-terminal cleavage/methylation domain-containing protein, partial [Sedimentisphaerales bacterium]|nr:prepilin-type N-terminal cleavage/methylation domain-containing protein [Sedimentisphaerales bacterium]